MPNGIPGSSIPVPAKGVSMACVRHLRRARRVLRLRPPRLCAQAQHRISLEEAVRARGRPPGAGVSAHRTGTCVQGLGPSRRLRGHVCRVQGVQGVAQGGPSRRGPRGQPGCALRRGTRCRPGEERHQVPTVQGRLDPSEAVQSDVQDRGRRGLVQAWVYAARDRAGHVRQLLADIQTWKGEAPGWRRPAGEGLQE